MKKPREWITDLSDQLDIPCSLTAHLPCTVIDGFHTVTVDLQRGLLAYSEEAISVAVPEGRITVEGCGLSIRLMKADRIIISGRISTLHFMREDSGE